jgi:hypothetical protein
VIREALGQADASLDEIDAVAVTVGPGLIGALLVGVAAAKALAWSRQLPLVPVDHLHGHVASLYLRQLDLEPPFTCLLASGGHTLLLDVRGRSWADVEVLGRTLDDAAGEAFDKGARLLGLPYPGGAEIDRCRDRRPKAFSFPVARVPASTSRSGLGHPLRRSRSLARRARRGGGPRGELPARDRPRSRRGSKRRATARSRSSAACPRTRAPQDPIPSQRRSPCADRDDRVGGPVHGAAAYPEALPWTHTPRAAPAIVRATTERGAAWRSEANSHLREPLGSRADARMVADTFGIDDGLVGILSGAEVGRVSIPTQMDDSTIHVFNGYRSAQRRAPPSKGIRYHDVARRDQGARDGHDVEVRLMDCRSAARRAASRTTRSRCRSASSSE